MKILILFIGVVLIFCTRSLGQIEEVKISRCTKTHVTVSEIDIITSPLPQDDEGKTVSQIKAGFTTLYVSRKSKSVNLEMNQEINKLFNEWIQGHMTACFKIEDFGGIGSVEITNVTELAECSF